MMVAIGHSKYNCVGRSLFVPPLLHGLPIFLPLSLNVYANYFAYKLAKEFTLKSHQAIVFLKLDFAKAYAFLELVFLLDTLLSLGFPCFSLFFL